MSRKLSYLPLVIIAALAVSTLLVHDTLARGPSLTTTLTKDANNESVQIPPTASLVDNRALAKVINNVALTTNVVTITTTATHGYLVGQLVTVAAVTNTAVNGSFVITGVNSGAKTFTYALTHADIVSGADTGSTTLYNLSPAAAGTTELTLVFPAGSFGLVVMPTTSVTDCTWSFTSGGGVGGTFHLVSNTGNVIAGTAGDTVYIQRGTSTAVDFQFCMGK